MYTRRLRKNHRAPSDTALVLNDKVNTRSASRDSDEHMAFWPDEIQAVGEQFLVDFVEQPVTSSKSTNENDVL
jgi:hypothetical protein